MCIFNSLLNCLLNCFRPRSSRLIYLWVVLTFLFYLIKIRLIIIVSFFIIGVYFFIQASIFTRRIQVLEPLTELNVITNLVPVFLFKWNWFPTVLVSVWSHLSSPPLLLKHSRLTLRLLLPSQAPCSIIYMLSSFSIDSRNVTIETDLPDCHNSSGILQSL